MALDNRMTTISFPLNRDDYHSGYYNDNDTSRTCTYFSMENTLWRGTVSRANFNYVRAYVASTETLHEFIRGELPYRGGKSSADCMRAVHTTSAQRKEHLVKGNSPSRRQVVHNWRTCRSFCVWKHATRTPVFFFFFFLFQVNTDSRDLRGRSFLQWNEQRTMRSTIRRGRGQQRPVPRLHAGVAASNASRGRLRWQLTDRNSRPRFPPKFTGIVSCFVRGTNSGWHDAYVRLSRKSPVSWLNQLFGKSTETGGTRLIRIFSYGAWRRARSKIFNARARSICRVRSNISFL